MTRIWNMLLERERYGTYLHGGEIKKESDIGKGRELVYIYKYASLNHLWFFCLAAYSDR